MGGAWVMGGLAGAGAVNALSPAVLPHRLAFEPNTGYWSRALPPTGPRLAAGLEADVVVVGGGFLGLATAFHLRRTLPGRRVVLLEAVRCGNGASGRNGAMLLTSTGDRYLRMGADAALDRRLYQLTADNIHALETLAAAVGIDCELDRAGALQVLDHADEVAAARELVRRAADAGLPYEFWDRERTRAAIGTSAYAGALYDPASGQLHPGKLIAMWRRAAQGAGAEIYEDTPVVDLEEGAVHTLVTRDGHRVRTPVLVLATNAYTSRLGQLRNAVVPVFDYVGITPVLAPDLLAAIGWRQPIPFNDSRTEVFYAGQTRDGRIHLGGGPVDYGFNDGLETPPDAPRRHAALERELARLYPALRGVGFEYAWSGSVDMSLDESPAVGCGGRHRNIFYGIGFSGHGVNLTGVFGRVLGDLVAGNRDDWRWLPYLDRLPPYLPNEPFRWLAVRADIAYTRVTEP